MRKQSKTKVSIRGALDFFKLTGQIRVEKRVGVVTKKRESA